MSQEIPQRIYRCLLPKEQYKGEEREQGSRSSAQGKEKLIQVLGPAEQLMNAVGGLKVPRKLIGTPKRYDQVSFELLAIQGTISFFVVVPQQLDSYLQQHLRSNYADIELEPVADYNIFQPQGTVAATYITQARDSHIPLKTYMYMDNDPLEVILGILSKIGGHDSVAIQFITRSAPSSWHEEGLKAVGKIKAGKNLPTKQRPGLLGEVGKTLRAGWRSETHEETTTQQQVETKLSPREEEMVRLIEEKNTKAGLEVTLRIVVTGPNEASVKLLLDHVVNSFSQYNIYEYGNALERAGGRLKPLLSGFIHREFENKGKMILNVEELASLWHLPLPTTSAPNIVWLSSRRAPAPVNLPDRGPVIGINVYRDSQRIVRLKEDDRRRHVYIIGTTGTGKSYFMYNLALQDLKAGKGIGVVDPHGDFVEYLMENLPPERYEDVVYFDPSDTEHPIGLNMLEAVTSHEMDFVTQEMISIFYKLVPNPEMIGPVFEHNMRNAMLTLMTDQENPGTMAEIPRIFTDTEFQKVLLKKVTDPVVRAFWEQEMAKTSDFHKSEKLGYLISKVGRFVENSMVRNIIGQSRSGINFKRIMLDGKVLLCNMSKGLIGEINSSLMGLIIVSKLQLAAFANAALPQEERRDFYLYIDEFQNYTTDSIATILSEARKYRLNLTMAHQYLGQLVQANNDTRIKDSVLGNVGNIVAFRVGVEDAPTLAQVFAPVFGEYDLVNIEARNAYVKMMIDNTVQRAFSIRTIDAPQGDPRRKELLKELSRRKYGRPRTQVETEILERSKLGQSVAEAEPVEVGKSL